MSFLTEDEVARGVIKALKSEEGQKLLTDVMTKKLEMTAGWDCADPGERAEIRKDMEFIRTLRERTSAGVERVLVWALGIGGVAFLSWVGVKSEILK